MHRKVQLDNIDESSKKSVDLDQNSGLGMLRREYIAIDGNPPSLVNSGLGVSTHTIHHWGQLGAKEKYVDTAKLRDEIEVFHDRLLEDPSRDITDELAVDVDSRTTLKVG